jgi:hypothetical protein
MFADVKPHCFALFDQRELYYTICPTLTEYHTKSQVPNNQVLLYILAASSIKTLIQARTLKDTIAQYVHTS